MANDDEGVRRLAARSIPAPALVSEAARAALAAPRPMRARPYPDADNKEAWRKVIARLEEVRAADRESIDQFGGEVEAREMGAPVHVATPRAGRLVDDRLVVLDIHGGALVFGGGAASVRFSAAQTAARTGRKTYSVDYRMPPDHPYPAALDDCLAVYRALLGERRPEEIAVFGVSAGGNLAAALLLRAHDEGLPAPAAALLLTPELDLTESGDSFHTLIGLDVVLTERLMVMNQLYAGGADLAHPYLSPLFGDVSAFPPTFVQAGGRDIFLSNATVMHRKLRKAGVRAELHVWEGMPHGAFDGTTPEDQEVGAEIRAFLASL